MTAASSKTTDEKKVVEINAEETVEETKGRFGWLPKLGKQHLIAGGVGVAIGIVIPMIVGLISSSGEDDEETVEETQV